MSRKRTTIKYVALAAFILGVSAFAMWFGIFVSENNVAQQLVARYSYIGALLLGVISGFNFVVPIPAAAFIPTFKAAGESVAMAIAFTTLGMTIGDLVGYFIGKAGREVVLLEKHRGKIGFLEKVKERHHWTPLLLLFLFAAFIPFPNEILVAPLAFIGYRLKYIFPIALAGNAIFNLIASLLFLGVFEGIS